MTYVSPESEAIKRRLRELDQSITIKADARRALDATQEGLERQLQETVNRRQHGFATHVDVEDAARKLQDFRDSRWQRQSRIEKLVDESFAEK
jgi:hypothetical protein